MSESRARFEKMLDYDLNADNAAAGAFGRLFTQQQEQWVEAQEKEIKKAGGSVSQADTDYLMEAFKTEHWDKHKEEHKKRALAAHDGASKEAQADQAGDQMMDRAGHVVQGGISSMLMGGDFSGGISHGLRHAVLGAIMGIPFVGEFLAKIAAFVGSNVKSWFGAGEGLSWDAAGEKVERENIKARMGDLKDYANPDMLADMVNRSSREFTAEEKLKYESPKAQPEPAGLAGTQADAAALAAAERERNNAGQVTGGEDVEAPPAVPHPLGGGIPIVNITQR